jgi:hypothetical protein
MAVRAASRAKCSGLLEPSTEVEAVRGRRRRRCRALVVIGAVLGDDEDVEAAEGLGVGGECAVGCGDEDAAEFFVEAGADLDDAGSKARAARSARWMSSRRAAAIEIVAAAPGWGRGRRSGCFGEALDGLLGGAGGDEGGGAGGVEQALGAEVVGVGVAGALAGEDADAAAGADALAGGLDDLLVDAERGGGDGLEVEVGVVAAGGERLAQAALQQALGDAEFLLKKIALVVFAGGWSSLAGTVRAANIQTLRVLPGVCARRERLERRATRHAVSTGRLDGAAGGAPRGRQPRQLPTSDSNWR